ncbi:uncharacterized protein M421DRAFT_425016 [Didymella exigua CBS 183.55]|uniref:Uncharacterized protein n=1 Tax=Didymella exigua CBS 183.55 TaxID=1150837 RepID=A0A6A5R8W4_9PLEO|nr:uncharacterized protein M421DRAFT_425016 [Didymella exigua CBS 183.55]KAF1924182.1 hypothetical protein M421DRAFT_425016 [Didymella exigua CBS 183.55]
MPSAAIPAGPPPVVDPPVAPASAPVGPPVAVPPANQAVPPAASLPLIPAITTVPQSPLLTGNDFVTVQWVETHVGTIRTWAPQTKTFHFAAMSQAPLPGVGSIGMGTLTGKAGQTQTILMVVGAASTPAVDSKKVIGAAVAVGLAGLMI